VSAAGSVAPVRSKATLQRGRNESAESSRDGDSTRSFFFQAEDGIRDYKVTGVQTCALPISIETGVIGDPFEPGLIFVNHVQIKVSAVFGIRHIRRKNNPLSVWKPIRREICSPIVRHLMLMASVRVHYPELQIPRPNQIFRQQV